MASQQEVNDRLSRVAEGQINVLSGLLNRAEGLAERMGVRPPKASGFKDGGEFLLALMRAKVDHVQDPRLVVNAASVWSGEGVGAAGGFAAPDGLRSEILQPVIGSGSLLGAFSPVPTTSNVLKVAVDETSEWASEGITADIAEEGGAAAPSKPVLRQVQVVMNRVPALVHGSAELMGRSAGFQSFLWRALGRKIRNRVEALIVRGTGMDQPVGLLNSPALIVVTDTASTATSIAAADVSAMIARLLPGSFPTSIWVVHTTALPSVMALAPGLYNPSGPGPYGTLAGRPVYATEWTNPLNSRGDLMLVDPAGYLYGLDGPYQDATIAFGFDQSLDSFRASIWMGGAPLLAAPVTRRVGSDTLGHVVVLEGSRS